MVSKFLSGFSFQAGAAAVFVSEFKDAVFNFSPKDIFDIAVIALLVYAVLMLFIKTRSLPIIAGVAAMAVVYGLAIFFKLSLTQIIFKYFFGAFLLVLLVVFQRELRKFFEMIGVLGIRRKLGVPSEDIINIILRSLWKFADMKTGALVVFPGRDPLDRHIQGGFLLNGKISEPLLLSLFDKNSPGHDGAVIIENERIRRFGAHLPLAEKMDSVKEFGTRHRAALGISEKTDALCLVVSEERGIVSLAQNGQIFQIKGKKELEEKVFSFFEQIVPKQKFSFKFWLKNNIIPILASIGVAVIFWGVFSIQSVNVQRSFSVPVEFRNTPAGFAAEDLNTQEVIINFSASGRDFNLADTKSLKLVLDVKDLGPGWHRLVVNKTFVKKPAEFSIINIDPTVIRFKIVQASEEIITE